MGASVNKEIAGAPLPPPLRQRYHYKEVIGLFRTEDGVYS